ncbi:hypothetical protein BH09PSE3_BH09PSE3_00100 [soil metagenome]
MKWIFLLFLGVMTPVLSEWLKSNRRHAPKIWMLIGFLPFVIGPWHLYVAPVSWPVWPGYAKGIEISLLDAIALAIFLSCAPKYRNLPFAAPLSVYLFFLMISAAQAELPLASAFSVWQFARMMLVVAAVSSACRSDERAPMSFVAGMVAGLCVQTVIAGRDHLAGSFQTGGSLGHQNLLGLMSHFVVFPAVALLLSGKRSRAALVGPLAGAAAIILTASRATIGLAVPGYLATIGLSLVRKSTSRKMGIAVMLAVGAAIAAPIAIGSLDNRFAIAPLSKDYDERAAFERASKMIIQDHPFGVGANQYVLIVNTKGYAERAGIEPTFGSRSANVHNVYLLIAAETGILGGISFLIMILYPAIYGLIIYFKKRASQDNELLLGLSVAILIVAIHSLFEWIFVMYSSQYLFAACVGMIGGISGRKSARSRQNKVGKFTPNEISIKADADEIRLTDVTSAKAQ